MRVFDSFHQKNFFLNICRVPYHYNIEYTDFTHFNYEIRKYNKVNR